MIISVMAIISLFSMNWKGVNGAVSIRYKIPDAEVFMWFNHFDPNWNVKNENSPLANIEQGSTQILHATTPISAVSSTSERISDYDWDDVLKEIEKGEEDKRLVPNLLPTSAVQVQNQIDNESDKLHDFSWEDWLQWWKGTQQSQQQKAGLTNNQF